MIKPQSLKNLQKSVLTKIHTKQNIHTQAQNFWRICPFGVAPVQKAQLLLFLNMIPIFKITLFTLVKPVLNRTLQSLQSFKKIHWIGQTHFANSSKLQSFPPAKESSGTCFDASDCVCLAGLEFYATLMSRHWASDQLTRHTFHHTIYIAPSRYRQPKFQIFRKLSQFVFLNTTIS